MNDDRNMELAGFLDASLRGKLDENKRKRHLREMLKVYSASQLLGYQVKES